MNAILAIDAAWTATQPSGVALLTNADGRWRCEGLAPSYVQFEVLAYGIPVDWTQPPKGSLPDLARLLDAAQCLLHGEPTQLITVDMPLSRQPITSRRCADDAVSRAFGAQGCAVHSPSAKRPGPIADALYAAAEELGFPLATSRAACAQIPALIEVYPHPTLLRLLGAPYRVPYKVSKNGRYWPGVPLRERIANLLNEYARILEALQKDIDCRSFTLPVAEDVVTLASLKPFEDALDALVCGWVGVRYLAGRCVPYGDATAAIWIPELLRPKGTVD